MKQVSLSRLLIQQIMLAILAGLLVSLPLTLVPSYFIIQSNIENTLSKLQDLSQEEVSKHLQTGWREPNINLVINHLQQEVPTASFYLKKDTVFADPGTSHPPEAPSAVMLMIDNVESNRKANSSIDFFNGKLYAAYPINFKENCLSCHQTEVKAGTIKLNQQAGVIGYEAPFSTAMISNVSQILFFVLFLSTFIAVALYLTNRSIHQKLLHPLQKLSNRIVSLQLDSHNQHVDWQRTRHQIIEIDQIDDKISQHIQVIQGIYSKLDALTVTEHETGLFHRDRFNEVMKYELMRSQRYNHQFGVVAIKLTRAEPKDPESFKALSEKVQSATRAHAFSLVVTQDSRLTDMTFRVSEDVFVIIAPETNPEGVEVMKTHIINHLKNSTEVETGEGAQHFEFNFKLGLACYPEDGTTSKQLMHEAAEKMKVSNF